MNKEMNPYNIQIIKSNRKTIAIEIKPDLSVIVRAPLRAAKKDILSFVEEKRPWIEAHLKKLLEKQQQAKNNQLLSHQEISELAEKALDVIPKKVKHYAELMGVSYGRITIRNQRTRWGSCSSKGNLNFNCLLMLTPEVVIDYVVVHELCHLKEMNHSKAFWSQVKDVLPHYREQKKWLKEHGNEIMSRMTGQG